MEYYILSHIFDEGTKGKVEDVLEKYHYASLNIDSFEQMLQAVIHSNPKALLIEINDESDPYFKFIRILRKSALTREIPLLIITSNMNEEFLSKLSSFDILDVIFEEHVTALLALKINFLLKLIDKRECVKLIQEVQDTQAVVISSLAALAETRDPETGGHIKRVQSYVKAMALELSKDGLYPDEIDENKIELMYMSVPLHDIGKVGISDDILLKHGPLTVDEFEVMKTHCQIGYDTIVDAAYSLKHSEFLEYAADVAYTHHEKFDGSGYPRGLKGNEIPLVGRLMAVADVYDALISKRVYKEPMSHQEAVKIIGKGSGKHFDPILVKYFLSLESVFNNIALTYSDTMGETDFYEVFKYVQRHALVQSILLVEDSRIVRTLIKNQLELHGFRVDEAENGEVGIEKLKSGSYDLALVDIQMPKMSGYEMVGKALESIEDPPYFLAITATDYRITKEELKSLGFSGMLLKPIELNGLSVMLERIFIENR